MDKLRVFSFFCLFTFIVVLANRYYLVPPLSPDSWSYYEISKTIFSDFYRFTTYRSYENSSEYSSSFPPLWPFLIAIFNLVFDLGPRAGLVINLLLLPLICLSLERLSHRLSNINFIGVIAFFITLSDSSFIDEVIAGRSIPLQVLLLINLFSLLVSKAGSIQGGFILGLCLMNRFDALVLVPMVALFLLFSKTSLKSFLSFSLAFAFTISTWIIYSLVRFSSPWKTDNSFVAKAVNRAYVTDWNPGPVLTLGEDFSGWLNRVLSNVYPLFYAYWEGLWDLRISFPSAILAFIAIFVGIKFVSKNMSVNVGLVNSRVVLRALCLFIGFRIFSSVPYLLTGYLDLRYFAFVRIVLILLLFCGFAFLFNKRCDLQRVVSSSVLFLLPLLAYLGVSKLPVVEAVTEIDPLNPSWISNLDFCLKEEDKLGVTFFPGIYNAFQFGAMSGNRSACLPENFGRLSVEERTIFLRSFGISHIVSSKDATLLSSELGVSLDKVPCLEPLYKISDFR